MTWTRDAMLGELRRLKHKTEGAMVVENPYASKTYMMAYCPVCDKSRTSYSWNKIAKFNRRHKEC